MNIKEFNYCLRHHPTDTMLKFNLHVNTSPRLIDRVCYSCSQGYAGTCPSCQEQKVDLPQWLAFNYFK